MAQVTSTTSQPPRWVETSNGEPTPLPSSAGAVWSRVREWVASRIAHAAERVGGHLDVADRDALRRLVDPDEPLGVQRRPDLFVLGASIVHAARRPE
jgi:hypothetical protein